MREVCSLFYEKFQRKISPGTVCKLVKKYPTINDVRKAEGSGRRHLNSLIQEEILKIVEENHFLPGMEIEEVIETKFKQVSRKKITKILNAAWIKPYTIHRQNDLRPENVKILHFFPLWKEFPKY